MEWRPGFGLTAGWPAATGAMSDGLHFQRSIVNDVGVNKDLQKTEALYEIRKRFETLRGACA